MTKKDVRIQLKEGEERSNIMKFKSPKYINTCSNCGEDVPAAYIVRDMPCPNCEDTVNFLESTVVDEIEIEITKDDIDINLSIVLESLEVYLKSKSGVLPVQLFTIQNPRLRKGFPHADFPSQYENMKEEIKDWVFENYSDVISKLA